MKLRLLASISVAIATVVGAGARADAASIPAATASAASTDGYDLGCPSPEGAPRGIHVWVRVLRWCALPGVRNQAQLKLQIRIKNDSEKSLDISRTHIRLIVSHLDPKKWSYPKTGQPTAERPFRTTYEGKRVWAIPPNAERAYDAIPGQDGIGTFATHWNVTTLAPGNTFNPVAHKTGAVVFYVPRGKKRLQIDGPEGMGVMGLAYVDGRDVIVMCPIGRWGPRDEAGDF